MIQADATDVLFDKARTHRFFTDQPVGEDLLLRLYDLVKFAPTESNFCPMRLTFVTSQDGFDRVIEAAAPGNKDKIRSAPVVVIVAHDLEFNQNIPQLAPHMDAEAFAKNPANVLATKAVHNTWMQAGYLIMAARALGLDCGPMVGFDSEKINTSFYENSTWRASMLINLGYGVGGDQIRARGHRLSFDEACEIR